MTCHWIAGLVLVGALVACSSNGNGRSDGGGPDGLVTDEDTAALCQDGKDNDGDGQKDCADSGCASFVFCRDAGADRGRDVASTDGGAVVLPDCPGGCAAGQVCWAKACVAAGPTKTCGTSKYGSSLPASGVIYVDGAFTGTSTGTDTQPYKKIGDALAQVSSSASIIAVASGTYVENLTISTSATVPSVELRCRCASGTDQVWIKGQVAVKPGSLPPAPDGGTSSPPRVVVAGCRITPPGYPGSAASCSTTGALYGIELAETGRETSVLVRDCVLEGWCAGIYANTAGTAAAYLPHLCISRTRLSADVAGIQVRGAPTAPVGASWPACLSGQTGADCAKPCQGMSESVAVELCLVEKNETGVVVTEKARYVALAGNLIRQQVITTPPAVIDGGVAQLGLSGMGVFLGNAVAAKVSSNRVEGNASRGIAVVNADGVKGASIALSGNALLGNAMAGILLQRVQATQASAVQIKDNLISGTLKASGFPDGDGIQVTAGGGSAYSITIEGNTVKGSARNGILLDGVGGTVTGNSISSSGRYGLVLQQSGATVGSNTYAGNAAGNQASFSSTTDLISTLPVPTP